MTEISGELQNSDTESSRNSETNPIKVGIFGCRSIVGVVLISVKAMFVTATRTLAKSATAAARTMLPHAARAGMASSAHSMPCRAVVPASSFRLDSKPNRHFAVRAQDVNVDMPPSGVSGAGTATDASAGSGAGAGRTGASADRGAVAERRGQQGGGMQRARGRGDLTRRGQGGSLAVPGAFFDPFSRMDSIVRDMEVSVLSYQSLNVQEVQRKKGHDFYHSSC